MVESHNAQLGRLITKRGNFFAFADELRKEVKRKETQLQQLLDGRQGVFDEPARRYIERSAAITKQQARLQSKTIGVGEFLDVITCVHNKRLRANLFDTERVVEQDAVVADSATSCLVLN